MALSSTVLRDLIITKMDAAFDVQARGRADMINLATVIAESVVEHIVAKGEAVILPTASGDGLQTTVGLGLPTSAPATEKTLSLR